MAEIITAGGGNRDDSNILTSAQYQSEPFSVKRVISKNPTGVQPLCIFNYVLYSICVRVRVCVSLVQLWGKSIGRYVWAILHKVYSIFIYSCWLEQKNNEMLIIIFKKRGFESLHARLAFELHLCHASVKPLILNPTCVSNFSQASP